MERGDIVVPNENDPGNRRRNYLALVLTVHAPKYTGAGLGAEIIWLCAVPPSEVFRHIKGHEHYDRFIDDIAWLDVVGHIDLPPDQG